MKVFPEIASKKYLIWLVSLTLFFSSSSGNSGSLSSATVKHLRQTELTHCHSRQKSTTHFPTSLSGIQATHPSLFLRNYSFRNRIVRHTQALALILKKSCTHFIPSIPDKGILHGSISSNEDEHPYRLKG